LGVSSLDLAACGKRRRPPLFGLFRYRLLIAGWCMTSWLLRHEIKLFTDDVSCDKLLIGGKPLAADALFGRFLP
jgi:hypothetical protein